MPARSRDLWRGRRAYNDTDKAGIVGRDWWAARPGVRDSSISFVRDCVDESMA